MGPSRFRAGRTEALLGLLACMGAASGSLSDDRKVWPHHVLFLGAGCLGTDVMHSKCLPDPLPRSLRSAGLKALAHCRFCRIAICSALISLVTPCVDWTQPWHDGKVKPKPAMKLKGNQCLPPSALLSPALATKLPTRSAAALNARSLTAFRLLSQRLTELVHRARTAVLSISWTMPKNRPLESRSFIPDP